MSLAAIPGGMFKVTISKAVTRDTAIKTLSRLFMSDNAVAAPIDARAANHEDKPKRRGGRIWTKRPNKVHVAILKGTTATIKATAQHVRDLSSVAEFVTVAKA